MFGISYVTFVFCIMYYAPNRILPGYACYWFTPICYYQLISCINWPLVPTQNRGSPIPAASSETAQKTATRDRQKLPAQWVWKTAQLGGKTAELATLLTDVMALEEMGLVHFRTLVTLRRVRVRVGLELRLWLIRVRIRVRVRLR